MPSVIGWPRSTTWRAGGCVRRRLSMPTSWSPRLAGTGGFGCAGRRRARRGHAGGARMRGRLLSRVVRSADRRPPGGGRGGGCTRRASTGSTWCWRGGPSGKDHLDAASVDRRRTVLDARGRPSGRGLGVVVSDDRLIADQAAGYEVVVMGADKWAQVVDPAWYGGRSRPADAARGPAAPGAGRPPARGERPVGVELLVLPRSHRRGRRSPPSAAALPTPPAGRCPRSVRRSDPASDRPGPWCPAAAVRAPLASSRSIAAARASMSWAPSWRRPLTNIVGVPAAPLASALLTSRWMRVA